MLDPIGEIAPNICIDGEPWTVQLDQPNCPTFLAGCDHAIALANRPEFFGIDVAVQTKTSPNRTSPQIIGSEARPKLIELRFHVIPGKCCGDEVAEVWDVTGAFGLLAKDTAVLTLTDGRGRPFSYTGVPNGSRVIPINDECYEVRAGFTANDPAGYGPKRWIELEFENDPSNPGNVVADFEVWNHGNYPSRIWFEPQTSDNLLYSQMNDSLLDLLNVNEKRTFPHLVKGRNDLRISARPEVLGEDIRLCYREAFV